MIKIIETECSCQRCQSMCYCPCCGTPGEIEKLIEAGYGSRLMLDDDPLDENPETLIKPALKGYEGERAPYEVWSPRGCTFFKNGKCELHDLKLKPYLGRVAYHTKESEEIYRAACEKLKKSWRTKKAAKLIEKFKKSMGIKERKSWI